MLLSGIRKKIQQLEDTALPARPCLSLFCTLTAFGALDRRVIKPRRTFTGVSGAVRIVSWLRKIDYFSRGCCCDFLQWVHLGSSTGVSDHSLGRGLLLFSSSFFQQRLLCSDPAFIRKETTCPQTLFAKCIRP